MPETRFTPVPWLSPEGEWLHDPRQLLEETGGAWLMGHAPTMHDAIAAFLAAHDAVNATGQATPMTELQRLVRIEADAIRSLRAALAKARGEESPDAAL